MNSLLKKNFSFPLCSLSFHFIAFLSCDRCQFIYMNLQSLYQTMSWEFDTSLHLIPSHGILMDVLYTLSFSPPHLSIYSYGTTITVLYCPSLFPNLSIQPFVIWLIIFDESFGCVSLLGNSIGDPIEINSIIFIRIFDRVTIGIII